MDRRDFLKGLLATGVAATVAPSIAAAMEKITSSIQLFSAENYTIHTMPDGWFQVVSTFKGKPRDLNTAWESLIPMPEMPENIYTFSCYVKPADGQMITAGKSGPIVEGAQLPKIEKIQLELGPQFPEYILTTSAKPMGMAHNLMPWSERRLLLNG